jgi:hypothetical protein
VAWVYLKHYAAPLIEKVLESELSVKLVNGAVIRLFGADNIDSLRGNYFDGIVLDEYADMSPRVFAEVVAPALSDRKGFAVFIGTPRGFNHFKEVWDESEGDPRWFRMMLKASESGVIDAEELEQLRNLPGSDENTYQQEMECSFTAAIKGSYYGDILNSMDSHMGNYPYDPARAVHLSFDIGISDDTSIFFFQSDGKHLQVIDSFSESGYSVDDIIEMLRSKPYAYGDWYLPHDAANKSFQTGKSVRELFIAAGATTRMVANLSVQDGIQGVRATLPKVFFNTSNPSVATAVNALKMYSREWDEKKKMFKASPKHDWSSNLADSFRYMCLAMNAAAVKRSASVIKTMKPEAVTNNVLSLEALYRDRKAAQGSVKRI